MIEEARQSHPMITYEKGTYRFNYRVAGLFLYNHRALLHRTEMDDFWSLPGGRVHFMESSEKTIQREMKEEMGIQVDILRLLWIVENFFEYEDKKNHEICLYYLLKLPKDSSLLNTQEFTGNEEGLKILFKWFPIEQLEDLELYPSFLRTEIGNLPDHVEHIVHVDE